jgi:hypothetical protein
MADALPRRRRAPLIGVALSVLTTFASSLAGCGDGPMHEDLGENGAALTANDKTAYDYFINQGLSGVQAAGIVGNLDVESGMDPTAVESGGPGRGIAQWSAGGRWDTTANDNVIDFATMKGEDHLSLQLQLEFIWYELTTFSSYGLAQLRAATTTTEAVNAFQSAFEGCGACDSSARVADADNAQAAYGGDVPSDGGGGGGDATTVPSGPACTVTTTGAMGECISTADCASLGGQSTPGFCPGAADIQCCTGIPTSSGSTDGGAGGASDGGGTSKSPSGAGSGSSGAPGLGDANGNSSGGCSAAPSAPSAFGGGDYLLLVLLAVSRLRRRVTGKAESL